MKKARTLQLRIAVLVLILLVVAGEGLATTVQPPAVALQPGSGDASPLLDPTLPDPLARQPMPLLSIGSVVFLVAVAVGALWLDRRRRMEPEEEIQPRPEGPRVMRADEPRGRRRTPRFYEDLRQRESMLENLEERGPDRARLKIIELPVPDGPSAREDD